MSGRGSQIIPSTLAALTEAAFPIAGAEYDQPFLAEKEAPHQPYGERGFRDFQQELTGRHAEKAMPTCSMTRNLSSDAP
jgi:hypothetical protein